LNTTIIAQEAVTIATTTGATGIGTATGLPTGMTATWSNNSIKISGTPTAASTFNYTIPLTGGCGSVNATGSITVVNACKNVIVDPTTVEQTIFFGENMTPINIEAQNATGISIDPQSPFRLPNGLEAIFDINSNFITILGKPTEAGMFMFKIEVTGGCEAVFLQGTINVSDI
jgi:hypothetical protein